MLLLNENLVHVVLVSTRKVNKLSKLCPTDMDI